jgi:hypothetical protein
MRLAIALALVLLARVAAAAPLDDALNQLTERFRLMADAYGLTAEIYIRCDKKPELAKRIRASLDKTGEQLQREAGIKTSLKEVANRAFAAGRKRGAPLLCSDKPEEVAAEARRVTMARVNEAISRVNELKQQEKAAKPQ